MKRMLCIIPIIQFLFIASAGAVTLKWEIPLNQRLEIMRTSDVEYLVNSKLEKVYQERNIIDLTCYKKEKDSSRIRGEFSVYKRESGMGVFHLRNRYSTDFAIASNGKMYIDKKYFMPNLRHVPTFPVGDINPGHSWSAPAIIVLKNFSLPLRLLLNAEYKLVSLKKRDGHVLAIVDYHFTIDKDLTKRSFPRDFPIRILGKYAGTFLWDIKNNSPFYMKDKYRIIFVFRKGRIGYGSIEFRMNIESKPRIYTTVSQKEKEKAKKEIEKALPPDSDINVDTNRRGLVLRLGEVLFDFDSHKLRKKSINTLRFLGPSPS